MTTKVHKSIMVDVPVATAYNQWTQFEDFPHFMGGVTSVTQLSDDRLQWVAEIAGVKREWEARILEQVPDRKIAWAATEGATNAGAVTFEDVGGGQTQIHLELEYEPEGLVETAGDKLGLVERQAVADLERFKEIIESEGYASGAWRGTVNPGATIGAPGVGAAAPSEGDSGRAGVSGKAAAAAVGAAAAGAAAVAAAKGGDDRPTRTAPSAPAEGFDPGAPPGTPPAYPPTVADDESIPPAVRAQANVDPETGLAPGEGDRTDVDASGTGLTEGEPRHRDDDARRRDDEPLR
ncbi:SRPBCC family protein [Georgenia muralis]|uniref:Polyketide cyclase/dehydrase/lipid transport protein n=1 Tax=Georgenia muralis TaxID=154117 RepID=A0A3N4Z9T7_9MICO|nr:SRPBCC family protein [Georgenia muralis]RPF28873.1 polyketide cyclase/dehydrase/lipid transport protein [Georgenia muralis]